MLLFGQDIKTKRISMNMMMSDDKEIFDTLRKLDNQVVFAKHQRIDTKYRIQDLESDLKLLKKGYAPTIINPHTLESSDQMTYSLRNELFDLMKTLDDIDDKIQLYEKELFAFEELHPRYAV